MRIIRSNGEDGDLTISSVSDISFPAKSGCSGTSGTKTLNVDTGLTINAGDVLYIHQSRAGGASFGKREHNQVESYNSGTGAITLVFPLENTYSSTGSAKAQMVVSPSYATVTINDTFNCVAWDGTTGGFVMLRAQVIQGSGSINVNAKGFRGGQRAQGTNVNGYQGEGSDGPSAQLTATNGNGGGGGYKYNASEGSAAGGGGGANKYNGGTAFSTGADGISQGGVAISADELDIIFFGGGGGSGGTRFPSSEYSGRGGHGGGFIDLFFNLLDLTSLDFEVDGEAGENASRDGMGGGGSGAGGCAKGVGDRVIGISTIQHAITGLGGSGGNGNNDRGGTGSVGRFRFETCEKAGTDTNPAASYEIGGHDFCQSFVHIY